MPGSGSAYLPPIVATIVGEAADVLAKIEEVKAAIQDLSKTPTDVTIGADITEALAKIAELKAYAQSLGQIAVPITVSDSEALTELMSIDRTLNFIANQFPIDIPASIDMGPAMAEFIAATLAMRRAADDAGGGSGGIGLIGALLWGAGGRFGMAQFGSILSLAGFGFEHLATTVLGLAGSLSGALVGALTLAAASFAVMGVGMLTDMTGIGQAIGDIQQYTTLQGDLNQAIAVYGKSSTEAALAQYQMNQWMKDLSPATVTAIKAASNTAAAFHAMFDQVTAQAETTGAQIINTVMLLGEKFLPIIGQFAAENMKIIQSALVPLETWLAGPGLAIFTELEQIFQRDLPYAMQAFDNGVELVIKILGYAAQQTGGFIKWLAAFFEKWNSAAAWPTVEKGINTVIGLFHTWWDLLKQIGITIFDLFSKTAGLGKTIVAIVTQMLVKLDQWIASTSGSGSLRNLFEVHLQEVKALLALLPSLLSSFGQLYLVIGPDLTQIVAWLADAVNWMLKIPGAGPLLAWAAAIAVLVKTTKIVAIGGWIASAIRSVGLFAASLVGLIPVEGGAATAAVALGVAIDFATGPIGIIIEAVALVVVGLVLLLTHMKQVTSFLSSGWGTAFQIALAVIMPWIGIPLLIIAHWQQIVTFFHNLPGWIMDGLKALPGLIGSFFKQLPGWIWNALKSLPGDLVNWAKGLAADVVYGWTVGLPKLVAIFANLGKDILGWIGNAATWLITTGVHAIGGFVVGLVQALPTILAWMVELPFWILSKLLQAGIWLVKTGISVVSGFVGGLVQAAPTIWNWFISLPGWIWSHLVGAATWLFTIGISVITGFMHGVGAAAPSIWSWFTALPGHIVGFFASLPGDLWNIGWAVLTGFWHGLEAVWNGIYNWLKGVVGTIIGFFKSALGIHSPSSVFADVGQNVMLGLQTGLAAGLPGVMGVMSQASAQLRGAISPSKLALSGTANASILHTLANAQPSNPGLIGNAGATPSGSQTITVQVGDIHVVVPAGTPAQIGQRIGGEAQASVNKALSQTVKALGAGSKQYSFQPG